MKTHDPNTHRFARASRVSKNRRLWLLLLASGLAFSQAGFSQPLFSFESGVDGWTDTGFSGHTVSLATSSIGATDGSQSLALTQMGAGWGWDAHRYSFGWDNLLVAVRQASANPGLWRLEFDVTYQNANLPDSVAWMEVIVAFNSDDSDGSSGGWRQVSDVARTDGHTDETIHVSIPLTDFVPYRPELDRRWPVSRDAYWFELVLGLFGGGWSDAEAATVYFDNIRITSDCPVTCDLPDYSPPTIHAPNLTVSATSASGAPVVYGLTAVDNCPCATPVPVVDCYPPSGSQLPIGTTWVTCLASDVFGNTSYGFFAVTVKGAWEQLGDLIALTGSVPLSAGRANSLLVKLRAAQASSSNGPLSATCGQLGAFIAEVSAASVLKEITQSQGAQLINDAKRIRTVLGCE